jgi:alpha-beta hydrolase superfamily lysophospholipase
VVHGEKDRICSLADSKFFIDNIKHKVKEHYVINNGYHEIYIDYEKEEFRNKILSWINKTKNLGKTDRRKNNLLLLISFPN